MINVAQCNRADVRASTTCSATAWPLVTRRAIGDIEHRVASRARHRHRALHQRTVTVRPEVFYGRGGGGMQDGVLNLAPSNARTQQRLSANGPLKESSVREAYPFGDRMAPPHTDSEQVATVPAAIPVTRAGT